MVKINWSIVASSVLAGLIVWAVTSYLNSTTSAQGSTAP
jgi:hypothetical protein